MLALSMCGASAFAQAPVVTQGAPPPTECAAGWQLDGGLCYRACRAGYSPAGATCRENCPTGYVDEGQTCRRDAHVINKIVESRGTGQLTRSDYQDLFASFMQITRAGASFFAQPLSADEQSYLRQFFPARLVSRVRVAMVPAINTPPSLPNVQAMTLGDDLVVIKQGERSSAILKHELVHVCQVDKLGPDAFMRDYADQYVDGGYDYGAIRFEKGSVLVRRVGRTDCRAPGLLRLMIVGDETSLC
jgi:hypothetical protein